MGSEFPREDAFDEDYLYFYEGLLTPERTAAEVELVWKLLELEPGLELLDLACGHGRIANALAERRVRVTGLDATPLFLDLARRDAAERGVEVEYVEGDMRSLPWSERFDRVLCWFTSFGYFSDDENRQVLREVYDALKPGGLFAVEMNNLLRLLQVYADETVTERGEDKMIDRHRFELGVKADIIRKALAGFGGVKRRFTRVGEWNGAVIIDDYAHHPVEIAAVLRAARESAKGQVIAVMQPHRYTRLHDLFEQFCTCFNDADLVIITPVYPAGEQPITGADRDALVTGLRARGHKQAMPLDGPEKLAPLIKSLAKPSDYVICLGAGSITQWAYALPAELKAL